MMHFKVPSFYPRHLSSFSSSKFDDVILCILRLLGLYFIALFLFLFRTNFCIVVAASIKTVVIVVAPLVVTVIFVHIASGCPFICRPKNLNISGCQNTLEGANNKLGPYN